jgi:SAM-dependent methyltransferase
VSRECKGLPMSLHVNYRYLLSKATFDSAQRSPLVLDYGCGSGQIIEEGRKAGVQIYGAEAFYHGNTSRTEIEKKGWLGNIVREIEHGVIPFDDSFFDLVISNMVFEHIQDLEGVLCEILRILKPGGTLLCMFPSKDVIREGHCGLPFIHWFPKRSRLRFYYAVALRKMGFGYHHKEQKSASQWASDVLQWLDTFTCYRDRQTIFTSFRRYFAFSLVEDDYIIFRLNTHGWTLLSRIFQLPFIRSNGCELFRRLAGLVILARKGDNLEAIPISGNPQKVFSSTATSAALVKGL